MRKADYCLVAVIKGVPPMGRSGWRVRLESGLKLDLNRLLQRGAVRSGAHAGPVGLTWTDSNWGQIGSARIWADMTGACEGQFKIEMGPLRQEMVLVRDPRHFGGGQWYFMCPVMDRRVSVLWKPSGASRFCSRQTWGRQVAYQSQFLSPTDRLWRAKTKLNNRLCAKGDFDAEEWDFPPKPKWMRWHSYRRFEERFERLEDKLDDDIFRATLRLSRCWKNS